MKYRFRSTQRFWENFYALSPAQRVPHAAPGKSLRRILSIRDCVATKFIGFQLAMAARFTLLKSKRTCESSSMSKAMSS